jgi:hypothetical protein
MAASFLISRRHRAFEICASNYRLPKCRPYSRGQLGQARRQYVLTFTLFQLGVRKSLVRPQHTGYLSSFSM